MPRQEMQTIPITLPLAFWDQVRKKGALVGVDFAENNLPEIVARSLEQRLDIHRVPFQQEPFRCSTSFSVERGGQDGDFVIDTE
jgi:hypothetical protein